ncbi:helix-turn-helix transcriptional regulator [Haloferula sargassicola]|uniref:HTH luxR-type domain-containing protein n=1 Tax=Haloferula sargassicola TaxID=490096 RepID=A0ABP9UX51_9BACT
MTEQLHDRFIPLALELQRSTGFGMLVGILCQRFPDLIEAPWDGWAVTVSPEGVMLGIGRGREGENLSGERNGSFPETVQLDAVIEAMEKEDSSCLAIRCHDRPSAWHQLSRILRGEGEPSDALVGRIYNNSRTDTLWCVARSKGRFSDEQLQVFELMLLSARAAAERLAAGNLERQFRKIYLGSPPSAHTAVFLLHPNGDALPINFQAIRLAEAWWSDDQAFGKVDETALADLKRTLGLAWADPVTSEFRRVDVPLGEGGPKPFMAMPRGNGEILMLHFADSAAICGEEALSAVLTRRQKEIMGWIAEGKTSAEVAIILNISPRTVEKHLEAVFQRLGVENRIAAVRRYLDLKSGLVD